MENAVEIRRLNKAYRDFGLTDISLDIPEGMVVGLIGENGAGKSTLIRSMLGVIRSNHECLRFFGMDMDTHEKEIREQIAVITDCTHYDLNFTPAFIGRILSLTYSKWDMVRYKQLLNSFCIPEKKKLKTFSRGMKMKLEFAIAFSHHARMLILDEATSGLDPLVRDEILGLIREFTVEKGHTVLLSSHITSDLDKTADYIACLHEGKLMFMKPMEEIREEYGIVSGSRKLLAVLNEEDIVAWLEEPYSCAILVRNRPALQQVFSDLPLRRVTVEELMRFALKGERRCEGSF